MKNNSLIQGAAILTFIGILTRIMGFFYRIFLSRTFGEEGVGLYQLIFPIYSFCLSFSTFGIQTALSRIIAYKIEKKDSLGAKGSLFTALILSVLLSMVALIFVQQNAHMIAKSFIQDLRTEELLIIMTYALPFAAVHGCICGYYFGRKKTVVPAISQLLEQFLRIGSVLLFYQFALRQNIQVRISFAVFGLVIGEIASSLCSVLSLQRGQPCSLSQLLEVPFAHSIYARLKELAILSVPLSANRMILTILQSVEAVSIPSKLQQYGYSVRDSLSLYGVLTGMALPCIMFPSAITNAFSVLLTPTVAGIQSLSNQKQLGNVIRKTFLLCFTLGLAACVFFLLFGNVIGAFLFHSDTAGKFILILAWICPFLYLNTALASILNGLGKTSITFLINLCGIIIRILSIFCLIPHFNLKGYLWGLLMSQFLLTISFSLYFKIYHNHHLT